MDPNQNPPSEREWTPEEMEEFFKSQDAITGLPNSALAGMPANALPFRPTASINHCGDELAKEWPWCIESGIHVTSITPPEQGWPVAFYCQICKETTFILSPYAVKPSGGDYHQVTGMCANLEFGFKHNMEFAMKMKPVQIKFQPLDPLPLSGMQLYMRENHISSPYDAEFTQELPIEEVKKRYPDAHIPGEDEK